MARFGGFAVPSINLVKSIGKKNSQVHSISDSVDEGSGTSFMKKLFIK